MKRRVIGIGLAIAAVVTATLKAQDLRNEANWRNVLAAHCDWNADAISEKLGVGPQQAQNIKKQMTTICSGTSQQSLAGQELPNHKTQLLDAEDRMIAVAKLPKHPIVKGDLDDTYDDDSQSDSIDSDKKVRRAPVGIGLLYGGNWANGKSAKTGTFLVDVPLTYHSRFYPSIQVNLPLGGKNGTPLLAAGFGTESRVLSDDFARASYGHVFEVETKVTQYRRGSQVSPLLDFNYHFSILEVGLGLSHYLYDPRLTVREDVIEHGSEDCDIRPVYQGCTSNTNTVLWTRTKSSTILSREPGERHSGWFGNWHIAMHIPLKAYETGKKWGVEALVRYRDHFTQDPAKKAKTFDGGLVFNF